MIFTTSRILKMKSDTVCKMPHAVGGHSTHSVRGSHSSSRESQVCSWQEKRVGSRRHGLQSLLCPWGDKWLEFCLWVSIAIKWHNHIPSLGGVLTKLNEKQHISSGIVCSGRGNPAFVQDTFSAARNPPLPGITVLRSAETLAHGTLCTATARKGEWTLRSSESNSSFLSFEHHYCFVGAGGSMI